MPEVIQVSSSWNLPPTAKQCRQITLLCMSLKIRDPLEDSPSTRWEARNLIYDLRQQRKLRPRGSKQNERKT